jgi:predicted AAA+ superfamily ATPase
MTTRIETKAKLPNNYDAWHNQEYFKRALELEESCSGPVSSFDAHGYAEAAIEPLIAAFIASAEMVRTHDYYGTTNMSEIFACPDTVMRVSRTAVNWTNIDVTTTVPDRAETFIAAATKLVRSTQEARHSGTVYVLTTSSTGGICIRAAGNVHAPLELANYPGHEADIAAIYADLRSSIPEGRLTILSGAPGTGKSFLIKSIITEVRARYIFVPPHLVSHLGDPNIISVFSDYPGTTVLICEDADSILAERGADNMPSISSLLNLSDGIFGDLLDIRVIATTNAKRHEMDKALSRTGRLTRHINFDALKQKDVVKIFERLFPEERHVVPDIGPRPLAEVYSAARKLGWTPPPRRVDAPDDFHLTTPRAWPHRDGDKTRYKLGVAVVDDSHPY